MPNDPVMWSEEYDDDKARDIREWAEENGDPSVITRTKVLGSRLRAAGIEVRYVYAPVFLYTNEAGQSMYHNVKSRLFDSEDDPVSIIKEHAGDRWVFLYMFTDSGKVRYELVDPKGSMVE